MQKALLESCEVQSSAAFCHRLHLKVKQAVCWFGFLHRNISCTDSCWVNCGHLSHCARKNFLYQENRSKILCNASLHLFSCRSPPPPPKGKEGVLSPLCPMRLQAKSPMHHPTSSLDSYRNTICTTLLSDTSSRIRSFFDPNVAQGVQNQCSGKSISEEIVSSSFPKMTQSMGTASNSRVLFSDD